MAGKKDKGAEVDFFGDEGMDWLGDEDAPERAPHAAPPVAPPPPPPPPPELRSAVSATPAASEAEFWGAGTPPKEPKSSEAPTLIFSSVPTLPPQPSPLPPRAAPGPSAAPEPQPEPEPEPDIPTAGGRAEADTLSEAETVELAYSSVAAARAAALSDGPSALAAEEPRPGTEELESAPTELASRASLPSEDPPPAPAAAPSAPPEPSAEPVRASAASWPKPSPGEGSWADVLNVLRAEIEAAPPAERGGMATAGGLVALRMVGSPAEADTWFSQAYAAGDRSPELLRLWAEARGILGQWPEQEATLLELAEHSSEPDRAEARLEAALVAWRRRQDAPSAVQHLTLAAQGMPEDYTSRALLRSLLPAIGRQTHEQRLQLLSEVAGLAQAGIAADAWVERAAVAQDLGEADAVRESLLRALEVEPGHTFAFQRLEQHLSADPVGLAGMYEREATRAGQTDSGWWWTRVARALEEADPPRSVAALQMAIDAGWSCGQRELQGLYLRVGDDASLESALRRETDGPVRPWSLFRAGWLAERSGRTEAALEAYRGVLQADPGAGPAVDGVARLSRRQGKEDSSPWVARLAASHEPDERRALRLRLAEIALLRGDHAVARPLLEAGVAEAVDGPEREICLDLLDLVLSLAGDAEALSALRRQRADDPSEGSEPVDWLLLAATAAAPAESSLPALLTLLDLAPEHRAGLALASAALTHTGRHLELGERLRTAAEATVGAERRAALLYRAARTLADHGGDLALARQLADRAFSTDGRLRSARWLTRSLASASDSASAAADYRAAAGTDRARRGWNLFAAAVLEPDTSAARSDLERLLADQPTHVGAVAFLEGILVAGAEREALLDLRQSGRGEESGQELLRDTADLADAGRTEEASLALRRLRSASGTPVRASARLAVSLGQPDLAVELLALSDTPEDRTERARLLAGMGRLADAMPLLTTLAEEGPDRVGIAARLATVAQSLGNADVMVSAYATLAVEASTSPLRSAYGAWAAMQMQAAGRDAEALPMWRAALAERPGSTTALQGAVRSLVARQDSAEIARLFAAVRPEAHDFLSESLRFAGDRLAAAEVLARSPGGSVGRVLSTALRIERLRMEAAQLGAPGDVAAWQSVYDSVSARRELCRTDYAREEADLRRRWLLAEKLASTELAWDMYRKFHQEAPGDREVTEALVGIASARGEAALAVGFLRELAENAPNRNQAARHRCRMGEILEGIRDVDGARQAFLDALDHVPDDAIALRGLRRLAEGTQDWQSVVAVLQREAAITQAVERKLELLREAAQVTEEHLTDPALAIDAWRAVLDLEAEDTEALRHVVHLASTHGAWGTFVENASALVPTLEGAERLAMLRRMGIACLDHLGREEGLQYLEQAVAGDPPDLLATQRLGQHARARSDWPGVVRADLLQAQAHPDPAARVALLLGAARLQLDSMFDKPAAAATYRKVLEVRPDEEVALRFLTAWELDQERVEEALPLCERLEPMVERGVDLDDFDSRVEVAGFYFSFAELLRKVGRSEDAVGRYERTLALNPAHLPSLEAVGPLYLAGRHWAKAENVYRQLVQLTGGQADKPRIAQLYTQLGLVERELGQLDKAYKRFGKALELHPNHIGALRGMAQVLQDRQDWSNLLTVYNTIIYNATQPEDVMEAYLTKGRILDEQMLRADKAAQHYQRSLDFDPNQPRALLLLAEISLRKDDPKEAAEVVERALALDRDLVAPWRARLLLVRAAAWRAEGHEDDAALCVNEARALEPSVVDRLGPAPLDDQDALRRLAREPLGS